MLYICTEVEKENPHVQKDKKKSHDRSIHIPASAPTGSMTLSNFFDHFYAWVTSVRMQMTELSPKTVVKIRQEESYI